jgi:hypothetical protein
MSSNNKKDPLMEPFLPGDEKTSDTTRTSTFSRKKKKDDKDNKVRPKEDQDKPSAAPVGIVTGATIATSSNNHDRAIRKPRHDRRKKKDPEFNNGTSTATSSMEEDAKPGHRERRREQDIENNVYVDSSSDDDSLSPGAVRVGGVINTLDSTRTFSASVMLDEPQQPVADRTMATIPSVLHIVAELVPETDDVENQTTRNEDHPRTTLLIGVGLLFIMLERLVMIASTTIVGNDISCDSSTCNLLKVILKFL